MARNNDLQGLSSRSPSKSAEEACVTSLMNGLQRQRDLGSSIFSTANKRLDHPENETTISTVGRPPDSFAICQQRKMNFQGTCLQTTSVLPLSLHLRTSSSPCTRTSLPQTLFWTVARVNLCYKSHSISVSLHPHYLLLGEFHCQSTEFYSEPINVEALHSTAHTSFTFGSTCLLQFHSLLAR